MGKTKKTKPKEANQGIKPGPPAVPIAMPSQREVDMLEEE